MRLGTLPLLCAPLLLLACTAAPATPPPAGPAVTPSAASAAATGSSAEAKPATAPASTAPWFEGCLSPESVAATLECREGARVIPFLEVVRAQGDILRRPVPKTAPPPKAAPPPKSKDTKARLAPIPFDAQEQVLLQLRRDFVCTSSFGVRDSFVDEKATTLYDLAQSYFEKNRFEEAAVFFRDSALTTPTPADEAQYAAQLFLEALNVLATVFDKPGCVATIRAHLPLLLARLCGPPAPDARAEVCGTLNRIQKDFAVEKHMP